jgi:hypothetical protein
MLPLPISNHQGLKKYIYVLPPEIPQPYGDIGGYPNEPRCYFSARNHEISGLKVDGFQKVWVYDPR